jgi:opacity protein-like surface antigen
MKRFASVTVILLVSLFVYTGAAQAGVGVRAWGGIGHIGYGQYNEWVDAFNADPIIISSGHEIDNMNWVAEFGGEVLFSAIPLIDIGVGAGMLLSSSDISISGGGEIFSIEHKLRSYPFTATAYFKPDIPFAFMKPIVYGGIGFYRTVLTWDYTDTVTPRYWDAELDKWGFGMHGGVGFEISVMPMMSIDLGVRGRWAKIKGFEGTCTHSDEGEFDVFLAYDEEGSYFSPENITNEGDYDEGEVDLSGFGFVFGVKVMF